MNSDDTWNPQIPEIKYNVNLEQKERKNVAGSCTRQSGSFVLCPAPMRQEFLDHLRLYIFKGNARVSDQTKSTNDTLTFKIDSASVKDPRLWKS